MTPDITEGEAVEGKLRQHLDLVSALVNNAADGLYTIDAQAHVTFVNPSAARMLGWPASEILGKHVHEIIHFQKADGSPYPKEECPFLEVLRTGTPVYDHEAALTRKDGSLFPGLCSSAPILIEGKIVGSVMSFRDITERKQAEDALLEQLRFAALSADVSAALIQSNTLPEMLQRSAEAMVQHLDAAFARIWTLNIKDNVLELQASAGLYTHLDGAHARVPVGKFKIGLIAEERTPRLTNDVRHDSRVSDTEWAEREGMIAFAGYPLIVEDKLIGVMAMFARRPLTDATLQAMASVANGIALGIERKQADKVSRESVERFLFLAESMPQKIFTARPNGDIDYFNQQWTQFTGLSFEQIRDWGWLQFIHPDDVEENIRRWQHSIHTGEPFQLEHRFRRADGEYRWHLSRAHAMQDADGNVLLWIGSSTDIDDVKRAEDERARLLERVSHAHSEAETARQRLHDLFMQAPAAICTLRAPLHTFEIVNPLYVQVTGRRDASELIGKPVREAMPELEGQGIFELLDKVYRTGEPFIGNEVPINLDRRGDGTLDECFFNFVYQPSRDVRGEIDGILVHAVEVTEQVRARRRVEETNRLKDEFLATVSHELRTPLTAIVGWSMLLRTNTLDEATVARGLETIERNGKAQAQLIEDLMDVSRIITGKLRLDVQTVELASVIEAAIESVHLAAEAKAIRLETILDPLAGPISGDPARLQQIVWNLLSNAIKFTPKKGCVQIRLERINSHIEIIVSDTGTGISPEFLPHVFDRFRQADGTSTRTHGGLGLGLAIVRHLVEQHGGTVRADSRVEEKGATFTVSLPLMIVHRELDHEEERRHPKGESASGLTCPPELDGLKVLVVDDEPDARQLLAVVLQQCGADVTMAASVEEALSAFERIKPDVLVSDIGMPGEDGYSLIRKIRALPAERGGRIPAAALTAYAGAEDRKRALLAGFHLHIPKPVDPMELVAVVATLAGRTGRA